MKLSPWWDGSEKPSRDGIYQRTHPGHTPWFAGYYNGLWSFGRESIEMAQKVTSASDCQNLPWRGILK